MALNNRSEAAPERSSSSLSSSSSSSSAWGVFSFGQNAYGELGLGDATDRNAPVRVSVCDDKRVADVACGNEQTVLLCGEADGFG